MIFEKVAIIGFGEAGPVFGRGFLDGGIGRVSAYDILIHDPERKAEQRCKTESLGIVCAEEPSGAVAGADLFVSTVTADQAVAAAHSAAPHLAPGQTYMDLNSVSPRTKAAVGEAVTASGADFVEAVAMDTVPLRGLRVPLLLSGPTATEVAARLNACGLNAEPVGTGIGQASSIKMLRSILIKGLESLIMESMLAAGKLGIQDRILASVQSTFPGIDWQKEAGYYLSRAAIHGKRRAAEMEAVAETVADLGFEPVMARAIAWRERWISEQGLAKDAFGVAPTVGDFLEALGAARARAGKDSRRPDR
jgi:3-hydroxyisobutyrate dehydrogenase-like beta-hydroxyacid dehydrogenase